MIEKLERALSTAQQIKPLNHPKMGEIINKESTKMEPLS